MTRIKMHWRSAAAGAVVCLALTGCAVGPDFRAPDAPRKKAYTSSELSRSETITVPVAGGSAQRIVPGQEIPAQWWTLFHSAELEQLVRQALADNPTLAAAQAKLRQAQEGLRSVVGSTLFPRLDANASVSRQ